MNGKLFKRIIKTCYCPVELEIEGRCNGLGCTKAIMDECWNETMEKYDLVFDEEIESKIRVGGYGFEFKPRHFTYENKLEVICIDDDCCGDIIEGVHYYAIGENTGRYILEGVDGEYVKGFFEEVLK